VIFDLRFPIADRKSKIGNRKSRQGVGRRASPLAADAILAGKAHDVPDDEEVVGQAGPLDHAQLVGQALLHGRWRMADS